MTSASFRSAHEPAALYTIVHLIRYLRGQYSDGKMAELLRARDRLLGLEMEASHHLHHVVHLLVELFPMAKFVLTVRHPHSWLESEITRNLLTASLPAWRALEEQRYSVYSRTFSEAESRLRTLPHVQPIDAYLCYWRDHNQKVLEAVPRERLLILHTQDLSENPRGLAEFLGVDPSQLDMRGSHRGTRLGPEFKLADYVDEAFLRERVAAQCSDLIARFFPGGS